MTIKLSHADLVERAADNVRRSGLPIERKTPRKRYIRRYPASFTLEELASVAGETPDVYGFVNTLAASFVIECKRSRSDFHKGRKKVHRRRPAQGMGEYRYYFTPPGLLTPKELPAHWGLLECHPKQVRMVAVATPHPDFNWRNERKLMASALRRLERRKLLEAIYDPRYTQYELHRQ